MDLVLVTPEEDEHLTVDMQTEFKRESSPVLRLIFVVPKFRGGVPFWEVAQ